MMATFTSRGKRGNSDLKKRFSQKTFYRTKPWNLLKWNAAISMYIQGGSVFWPCYSLVRHPAAGTWFVLVFWVVWSPLILPLSLSPFHTIIWILQPILFIFSFSWTKKPPLEFFDPWPVCLGRGHLRGGSSKRPKSFWPYGPRKKSCPTCGRTGRLGGSFRQNKYVKKRMGEARVKV